MGKKLLLVLLFMVAYSNVWAQGIPNGKVNEVHEPKKDIFLLRWAPLSLFEPHTPCVRISGEYIPAAFNNKVGFKFDYGYVIPSIIGTESRDNSSAFSAEYRAEIKYFPNAESDMWGYISGEFFFIDNNLMKENQEYMTDNGNIYWYSSSDIAINTSGFNVKIGKNYMYNSRVTFDIYAGLGMRFIDVKHDPVGLVPSESIFVSGFIPEISDVEGVRAKINVAAGVQIGLRL